MFVVTLAIASLLSAILNAAVWSPLPSGERARVRGESNEGVGATNQQLASSRDRGAFENLNVPTLTPALSLRGRGGRSDDGSTLVAAAAPIRFAAIDIIIDTKDQPLAVYQLEFAPADAADASRVTFVGIEGGEHEAFRAAPHYDPSAIQQERVIIGAFNTAEGDKLPRGKVKVATIHVQVTGAPGAPDAAGADDKSPPPLPKFNVKLTVSATVDGKAIDATATTQVKGTQL